MSDYTIDWSHTNIDGNNSVSGPDGNVTIEVATPQNAHGDEWAVCNGLLTNSYVCNDSKTEISFSKAVTDVSFTLYDVDSCDKITIYAKDADGKLVEVKFASTGAHAVNGNTVSGWYANSSGPGTAHNCQDIEVTIPGPVSELVIVLDNGDGRTYSGAVGVGDIHFNVAEQLDGTVEGSAGDDVIDAHYEGDTDGDKVDNNDALTNGHAPQDDLIYAYGGNDTVKAGEGNDTVYGGEGDDKVYGGAGNDTISGDAGKDFILAGDGDDTLKGGADDDTLCGQDGDDVIYGGEGNDILEGMNDNDTLFGGAGADTLMGDAGDDTLMGDAGDDTLTGGEGDDIIKGGDGSDLIKGGAGDVVHGGATGSDHDVLDLTGQGAFYLTGPDGTGKPVSDTATGGNGNGINGKVIFVDSDGNPTGKTLSFTDIEQVIGDKVNRGPDANDDTAEVDEDGSVTISVLGNDTDPDGNTLTVKEATSPNGEVTINTDGTITFVPADNFNGDTTISYTVDDGNGGADTATVNVTVNPVNDGPDAVDASDTTAFNAPITVNLLANDTDVDGDTLSVVSASVPAEQGTLVNNGDGTVTFTPAQGFSGEATISYTIRDEGGQQDSASHTITVEQGVADGTVEGTSGDDEIDNGYMGDAEGDRVDNSDAILPGDSGDDDLIYGYDGNDTVLAGAGVDEVYGGAGNDTINGQAGDDTLSGDEGNDSIEGGAGTDTIRGGDGEDIVRGGTGNDVIDGGADNDMVFGGAGNDSLDGGAGDDKIEGGSGNDTLIGGAGNDDLWGASGDDVVDGGTGNDTINTASGNDSVSGGEGDDIIDTSSDESPFTGQNLPDQSYPGVYPSDQDPNDDLDTVYGGAGNDTISTGDDDDTIYGGSGQDVIDAGVDDDLVYGGEGDDTITASEGNDQVYGGEGNDIIYGGLEPGVAGDLSLPDSVDRVTDNNNDTLYGGAGNDTIYGADDDDTLYGGDGNDTLSGGVDADEQYGGKGNDKFVVDKEGHGAGDVIVGGEDADLDGDGQSDDVDVLDLTGSGVKKVTYDPNDSESGVVTFNDGSTLSFSEIEKVIPCFTPGTTIATPRGERLVEELREGDRIITRDNGIQEIRWVGRKEMSGKNLVANPHLKPILIRAGALGNGLPERDMLVSPNHRVLVASEKTQLYFEEREVLAAAKHLVGSEGVQAVDVMGTAYIHFMFDRHEVVLSNGAWTESFQPGDYSLKGIGNGQRNEIFELFPELQSKQGLESYQSARRALKKHEARLLVQ